MIRFYTTAVLSLAITGVAVAQEKPNQIQNEIRVFNLVNLVADEASKLLSDLLGKEVGESIAVDSRRNAVIANSRPERLQTMEAILLKLDASPPKPTATTTLYNLKFAQATSIVSVLKTLFRDMQNDDPFRIGVDARSNSIVVNASANMQKRIRSILETLDQRSDQDNEATPVSIRVEIYWIADGEDTAQLPTEIGQVFQQNVQLGISKPTILASALVGAYIHDSSRGGSVSLQHVKCSDGSELNFSAIIKSLGDKSYKLDLQLEAGAKSPTSIRTTVQTSLGHPVFVASTTTSNASTKPTVFVVRLSG